MFALVHNERVARVLHFLPFYEPGYHWRSKFAKLFTAQFPDCILCSKSRWPWFCDVHLRLCSKECQSICDFTTCFEILWHAKHKNLIWLALYWLKNAYIFWQMTDQCQVTFTWKEARLIKKSNRSRSYTHFFFKQMTIKDWVHYYKHHANMHENQSICRFPRQDKFIWPVNEKKKLRF